MKFIPFGRARSLDAQGNKFECHHGPNECVANRIQSCTLEHLKGKQDAQQQFVVCQMRKIAEQTGKEVCNLAKTKFFFLIVSFVWKLNFFLPFLNSAPKKLVLYGPM